MEYLKRVNERFKNIYNVQCILTSSMNGLNIDEIFNQLIASLFEDQNIIVKKEIDISASNHNIISKLTDHSVFECNC